MALQIINKDKWWDMLSRFIDVLRINIFVVDTDGLFILPPDKTRFGGRLLTERPLGFDLLQHSQGFLDQFESHNGFLESKNRYQLHTYAIPIQLSKKITIAYMIVGPVVLNKRLEREEYVKMAKEVQADSDDVLSVIYELRIVSNMMIKSILDLLSEIMRDHVSMSVQEKELHRIKEEQRIPTPKDFEEMAKEIYTSVCVDELLVTLLDVALKMTKAECGSIMISDKEKGYMTVKASRGLDEDRIRDLRVKLGEGIAGIAAQEKKAYVIKGQQGDNRIRPFLNRPEIKESLIIPLQAKDHVFGVLSLSNKTQEGRFEENLDNLRYLTTLVSSAF